MFMLCAKKENSSKVRSKMFGEGATELGQVQRLLCNRASLRYFSGICSHSVSAMVQNIFRDDRRSGALSKRELLRDMGRRHKSLGVQQRRSRKRNHKLLMIQTGSVERSPISQKYSSRENCTCPIN